MKAGSHPLRRWMATAMRRFVRFLLASPGGEDAPPLTLAIPEARSSYDPGDVGWAQRPPARLRCPNCRATFVQQYANDVLRCPRCRFEDAPTAITPDMLIALECPSCRGDLETGIRHPNRFSLPQWASCRDCHYHWEFSHNLRL